MSKKPLLKARNKKIAEEWNLLFAEGLRPDVIDTRLAEKYFVGKLHINRILKNESR